MLSIWILLLRMLYRKWWCCCIVKCVPDTWHVHCSYNVKPFMLVHKLQISYLIYYWIFREPIWWHWCWSTCHGFGFSKWFARPHWAECSRWIHYFTYGNDLYFRFCIGLGNVIGENAIIALVAVARAIRRTSSLPPIHIFYD